MKELTNTQRRNSLTLFAIIFLALGLGAILFMPATAKAVGAGDLVKTSSSDAVYYLGNNNTRYLFDLAKPYYSWFDDFTIVQTISHETLAGYSLAGNIDIRAGTYLIQFVTINPDGSMTVDDAHVYALEPEGLRRWITTAEIAANLYGADWETKIVGLPNYSIINYPLGPDITTAVYPEGTLVREEGSSTIFYINGEGQRQEVTTNGFAENMFKNEYVVVTSNSLTSYPLGTPISDAIPELISVVPGVPANYPNQLYFVSTDGNDNNPGTLAAPFRTVSKGAQVAVAGDIVYIRAGVYEETVTPQNSGEEGKMIVYTNHAGGVAEIKGTAGYGFYLGPGVDYIRISGLKISRGLGATVIAPTYQQYINSNVAHGAGIKIAGSHHNQISNNIIYDNDAGIFVSTYPSEDNPATYNEIVNNSIYNNGEAGVRIKRSDYTQVDSNHIYGNGLTTNNVYLEPSSGITYYCTIGTKIRANRIYGNSSMAISNYAGTSASTCFSSNTLVKLNTLSQTMPLGEGTIFSGKKIVFSVAEQEITDSSHAYRLNKFYNGSFGSEMFGWGVNNTASSGEILNFTEFEDTAAALNPDSNGNVELTSNPFP